MNRIGLFALCIALLSAADTAASGKSLETPTELRGVWVFDHGFVAGESVDPDGELTGDTVEIVDGKLITASTRSDGTKSVGRERVEIDPTTSPKQMTIFSVLVFATNSSHTEVEQPGPAIYEVKGDTLRICIGNERPTEFSSKNARLIVFKRQLGPDATKQSDASPRRRPRLLMSNLGRRFRR